MKKKNLFWSMLAIMMVTMLSVGISACSSDDDDNGDGGVVGTWTRVEPCEGENTYWVYTLVFKSDNTGTWREKHEHEDENEEPCPAETGTFTYAPTSNTEGIVTLKGYRSSYSDEVQHFRYLVEGNKLFLYDNDGSGDYDVYTKQ